MKSIHTTAVVVGAVAVLFGCGDDKRGSKYAPLTAGQKAELREVTGSIANATGAVLHAKGKFLAALDGREPSKAKLEMAQLLTAAQCQIDVKAPELGKPGSPMQPMSNELSIKVSGFQCPIAMDIFFQQRTSMAGLSGSLNAQYQVKNDAKYLALNDVLGFELKGGYVVEATQGGADGKINFAGAVQSQKFGKMPVTVTGEVHGEMQKLEGLVTTLLVVPGKFTAELKTIITATQEAGPKVDHLLNGVPLTQQELEELGIDASSTVGGVQGLH